MELNTKRILGKFAAFSFLKTFGSGSGSSVPGGVSGARLREQGREGMAS